jgi:hypothetical protein
MSLGGVGGWPAARPSEKAADGWGLGRAVKGFFALSGSRRRYDLLDLSEDCASSLHIMVILQCDLAH